ncbi:ATP-binding protein [Companilactobacillus kedongensis]|uniref:ATP-binding protein n=1 Tax=Companilactobacillus kedongensis TaxID=2486004 RepID=UPI0013DE0699|nr:AAA family ATPase [Companilactobacillus kedongensis]
MKLTKIKIYGFGKWIDQEFTINADYQVIFGPNEAGKTTLLTFIKSILFGFATNRGENKYQQYKPKHGTQYGGELEFSDGNSIWTVIRVDGKSGGDLSLFKDRQQVPNNLISKITGGFSKEEYENTHVLNDKSIFSIYKLTAEQLETEIMSVGAVGSKEWLSVADDLEHDSDQLYKSRGRKQPLVQALDQNQKLLKQKTQFDNQQTAFKDTKEQVKNLQASASKNQFQYQEAIEEQNLLSGLLKKWPKYQEYKQLSKKNVTEFNPITTEDWEESLRLNQELTTLNNSQQTATLTADEQAQLNFYRNNKFELDDIKQHKNDLQQLQFKINDTNQSLNNNDNQIDQLFSQNPQMDENMQPLTPDEMLKLDDTPIKQSLNTPLLAVSAVALLMVFFMSGFLRFAAGLVFLVSLIATIYQQRALPNNSSNDFLKQKGYSGLPNQTVKQLQNSLVQLQRIRESQKSLEKTLRESEAQLKQWQVRLQRLNLDDQNELLTNIENYFDQLNIVQAKADLINSTQIESENSHLDRIATLQRSLKAILERNHASTMDELTKLRTDQKNNRNLVNQLNADKVFIGDDMKQLSQFQSLSELSNRVDEVNNKVKQLEQANNQTNRQLGSLKEKQEQIFDDSSYRRLISDLTQNEADLVELYDEWLADKLASDWIRGMLNLASENRYPKMLQTAKHYFNVLTDGNYVNIELNDQKLKLVRADKTSFDVHELSKATTVQLYLSLRLAFITEISDLVNLPILIDDAFVDFDSNRTENIMELVKDISKNNQIIYVTARLTSEIDNGHILKLKESKHA